MKNKMIGLAAAVAALGLAGTAHAALAFDQNVTPDVIFGSGNANGGFTTHRNNGVELGLRGKLRHNASGAPENTFNSNGDGTYSFAAGSAPTQSSSTAVWSFEWSINTDYLGTTGWDLDDLSYRLGLDTDPSQGESFIMFDPINDVNPGTAFTVQWDHAIGDNTTGNGGGSKVPNDINTLNDGGYGALIASNNVAQNSWKPHWFIAGFDPTIDATYDFYLAAYNGATELARTEIQIIVGNGGAVVPLPGAAGLGLLGLGLVGYMRRRKSVQA